MRPRVPSRRRLRVAAIVVAAAGGTWWYATSGEPVPATGAVGAAVTSASSTSKSVEGATAVAECRRLLVGAKRKLESVAMMSAVFQKQERIGEKLQPLNVMDLKVRRTPLSIYMKWQQPDAGQQILWKDGAHDGKILVSPAGWKRKIMPVAKIDPHGDMAMNVSRRPVTNLGIWNFTDRMIALVDEELTRDPAVRVAMSEGHEISGRSCRKFSFEHATPSAIVPFQNVTIYLDDVLEVPVACEHHRWSTENGKPAPRLEESYLFRDLVLDVSLTDDDFDHRNPALQFGAK